MFLVSIQQTKIKFKKHMKHLSERNFNRMYRLSKEHFLKLGLLLRPVQVREGILVETNIE